MKDFDEIDATREEVEQCADEKGLAVEEVISSLCAEPKDIVAKSPLVQVAETPGAMRILVILEMTFAPVGSDLLKERAQLTQEEWETARDLLLDQGLIQTMKRETKGVGYTLGNKEVQQNFTRTRHMFLDPEEPDTWDMTDWIGLKKFD